MPVEELLSQTESVKESALQTTDVVKTFEVLVTVHHRQVLAYAQSLVHEPSVAEDLAQEAFVVAWQKFNTFNPNLDFGKWVRGILHLKYRNLMREKRMRPLSPDILEAIDAQHDLWHKSENNLLDILANCLSQLTGPLRQAIDLHYLRDQDCLAIASSTGVQESTIRKRLQLGREALAACVERKAGSSHTDATGKVPAP